MAHPSPPPPPLLLLVVFLAWAPLAPALAANPYCAGSYVWHPDNTRTQGTADWSSRGATSAFVAGPCLGLSGIGVTETFRKTVLVIDRSAAKNGYLTLPGAPDKLAYAQELDLATGQQRGLDVITNTFCSSGQHAPDGSFISIGGDWSPDYAAPGEFSIRSFPPCTDRACRFSIVDNLTRSRWYPTSALLGDGRVIIVGGSTTGVGITTPETNVPYIEYFPKAPGEAYRAPFLVDSLPYNLYPFVHLLPTGKVFLFAGQDWTLWDTTANAAAPGRYPKVGAVDARGAPLMQSYPLAGTSAMFPLGSANGYRAEVMICGGGGVTAIYLNATGGTVDDPWYPASDQCFRIFPEDKKPAWIAEKPMTSARVMPVGVLLPDGNFLVISGTKAGHSGLGALAHNASLTPDMYDTNAHAWYKGPPLATSRVPRAYHSSALILHDGSVFLSGSNPNTDIIGGPGEFPTEFRTEFFHPPYMVPPAGAVRPVLLNAPQAALYGAKLLVSFRYPAAPKRVQVVLAQPGFSTHGFNHGMRNVVLDLVGPTRSSGRGGVHVVQAAVPLNRNLVPPTWYWLFVVVDGKPNGEGHHIFIRAK